MQRDFWIDRWNEGRIGFHRTVPTPALLKFSSFLPAPPARICVPMCGKATDLIWLAQQGYEVLGVEFSRIACEEFFVEHDLKCTITQEGLFEVFRSADPLIEILCGDFFDLQPATLASVDGVYDRAGLVALPPELRERYVRKFANELAPTTPYLLVSLERTQNVDAGPPFSLPEEMLLPLFEGSFHLEQLQKPSEEQPDGRGFLEVAYSLRRV